MMSVIGVYVKSPEFGQLAPKISFPCLLFAWFVFLLIRYVNCNGFLKAGICTTLTGVYGFFANYLVNRWIGVEHSLPAFHPLIWNVDTVDGNIRWLALIGCCVVGLALAARGIVGKAKEI